jgi:glc operon protein GlcG
VVVVLAGLVVARPVTAQVPAAQALTYEAARVAAEAAELEARANQWNVTILIVDAAGMPVYLKRMTGAIPRSYDFAMGKARTVIRSGLSTLEYAQRVREEAIEPIEGAVTLEGGLPIRVGGEMIGAISVSGVMPAQDAQVARAGLATFGGE